VIRLPFKFWRLLLKTAPICPHPRAIGIENIPPRGEPTLFVYNHVSKRGEPVFLALAAPAEPPPRFFIEMTLVGNDLFARTRRDVRDSVFSSRFQQKMGRRVLSRKIMDKWLDFLTRLLITQLSGFNFIPVYIHFPLSPEEKLRKRQINNEALMTCLNSLEKGIPVAIAPSGGYTHDNLENLPVQTIVPTLAALLLKRGKELKIVPSIIKEVPPVSQRTYWHYVADGMLFYRLWRQLLNMLKVKTYERPRLTVEFLPPLTFPGANSSKAEKIALVKELQEMMYAVLRKD
jgi:1-acyl-sn-glycerol-3-phosphate acyltransferase